MNMTEFEKTQESGTNSERSSLAAKLFSENDVHRWIETC